MADYGLSRLTDDQKSALLALLKRTINRISIRYRRESVSSRAPQHGKKTLKK